MKGRVLIVAGSDSGGGAGIQADIKTVTALGGYAMTAVTALTAQNTTGVSAIFESPPDFVAEQIKVVAEDIGADAVKTGMMAGRAIIEAAANALEAHAGDVPWVVDPVMVAKGGQRLLEGDAAEALKSLLVARAAVVTPNVDEAEALTGIRIAGPEDMEAAAAALLETGARAVLLKGGHLEGETVTDLLLTDKGMERFHSPRIDTPHTHGTGCTLSSAIAAGLAQGMSVRDAVARARAYVHEAILTAPGYGRGHGPLNHAHTVKPFGV
ncbi:MAG: bifunctional hydroxymethylpyrimidine kinase/phosphomethylpyrimidine kinase [Proteobacteria bacterium]|nr:bifunctional hydroxymethylpyrimidine kinase/phosphomethylpyrimidine kinase [Pseudomonadota bacterium]